MAAAIYYFRHSIKIILSIRNHVKIQKKKKTTRSALQETLDIFTRIVILHSPHYISFSVPLISLNKLL